MLAMVGFKLTATIFFGFQIFWSALLLLLTRRAMKFSWIKSLWVSAVFTSIGSFLLLILAGELSPRVTDTFLGLLPVLIVAAGMGIRAIVNCFGDVDDSGSVNSAERQRTLEMVEQGKITAEEGAELLEALGRSNAMLGQDKFSRLDMLILAGVAVAVFGFFLPWIKIYIPNFPQFQSKFMGGAVNPLASLVKGVRGLNYVFQSGYNTGAIGWAVLVVAILGAVPVFITPKNFLYKISMLQIFLLVLGGLLVISIMIRVSNSMQIGLPICMVGFVIATAGCFGKFKKLTA